MAINQNNCFFVDTTYILNTYAGFLDNNIDPNSLNTFILLAQKEQTQQLLGYTLYTKYISDITTGFISNPADANYKYLLDNYIVDSVSLWSIFYAMNSIQYRVTNKSVVTKNSQYSQPVSKTALNDLKNDILERAQFSDQRVREYILNFPYDFPEYYTVTGVMRLYPKTEVYFGGLYLGPGSNNLCGGNFPGQGMGLGTNLNF